MAESADSKSFFTAFLKVQKELDTKTLRKGGTNPHFHNKYVPLDGLLKIVRPVLNKNDLVLIQSPIQIDGKPALKTSILDVEGHGLVETMLLLMAKEDSQGQGSAITYARRYSLMALLGLAGDEDDDGNVASTGRDYSDTPAKPATRQPLPPTNNSPATSAQINLMLTTIGRKGFGRDQADVIVCRLAAVEEIGLVSKKQASEIIERLFKMEAAELALFLDQDGVDEVPPDDDDLPVEMP